MKLRWLILIAFIGVTLIPVALLGIWPHSKALQNEEDRVSDQHLVLARHLKLAMERYHRDAVSVFELLVTNTVNGRSVEGANRLMANVNFTHICVANVADGRVVHAIGQNVVPCPDAIPARRLEMFVSATKSSHTNLTGVLPNPENKPVIYLVQRRGNLIAVGALDTSWLRELGNTVAFGSRGHAAIVDRQGLVIAHPLDEWVANRKDLSQVSAVQRMMKGETGISKFYSPALEDDMIAGFTTVTGPGWGVMVPQPFSELEAKANSIRLFTLAVILGGFLIALAVAWFVTGYLAGPISAMADAARRLGDGNISARAELGTKLAPFELRNLLSRFNAMADTIQRNQGELENRVAERTRELHQSEQELKNTHKELERRIEERTQDLRASEQRFKDYADATADWFWEMDADLRFTYMSENVERNLDVQPEWHYGKTREELLDDDYDRATWAAHLKALRDHRPFRNFEYKRVGPDIETKWLRASGLPVFDAQGTFIGYRGSASDITEQKLAEEKLRDSEQQLRQSQKMEAIGQLTGGVAHDFNNLLAIITTNAELLGDKIGDDKLLSTIDRAATRGAELTQRLLAYARQQALQPQEINLAELVPSLHDLLHRTLGRHVNVLTDVQSGVWPVTADPGQLENALVNLSINARDAMPEGGVLEISCSNITLRHGDTSVNDEITPGEYVQISVRDTGIGMAAETREHAFEPFYTTKEVGDGSGLGLSMVYGFARQSGGDAIITSELGKGSEIRLLLPRSEAVVKTNDNFQDNDLENGRKEVILVLEDDPDIRESTVAVLEGLGYRALRAADADGALRLLQQEAGNVDLLLSDVVLTGSICGPEVADKAMSLYPNLKVVFMSGYASALYSTANIPGFDEALLTKPFKRAELAQVIHDTLAA
ncbi:MAG: response regulator [Alphaproteobacteria bacterium]|nr:response regulator [Alphaproteobacteria bacterium]